MLLPGEVIIHDGNAHEFAAPVVDGEQKAMGLVPREWNRNPCGFSAYAPMSAIQKIPRSEWSSRIKDLRESKSLMSDLRNIGNAGQPIPSRDQNGKGFCWGHSTVAAAILARAKAGQSYADLSAFAICCIIKGYRDQGGWNGESMEFLATRGCPTSEFWPQKSMSRSNDKPETWANAALFKDTEWDDIPEGDFDLQMTYAILGCPCPLDLNWWRHSICQADPVDGQSCFPEMRASSGKLVTVQDFDTIWRVNDFGGAYGVRIWNSWSDSWSSNGMGILTEAKARNNGCIALRVMTGS